MAYRRVIDRRSLVLGAAALFAGCAAPALPAFDSGRVLLARGAELHVVWEVDDVPSLWQPAATGSATLARYLDSVRARVDVRQSSLLERQRRFYEKGEPGLRGEAVNDAWVLANMAHVVSRACAIDLALFAFQAERYPMLEQPTEIGAFLVSAAGRLRVYASSTDRAGQKIRSAVTDAVDRDVRAGGRLVAHLHNHNFFFFDERDLGGGVAPSMTDVRLYRSLRRELGLETARVTNGFDTAIVAARDFDTLASRG